MLVKVTDIFDVNYGNSLSLADLKNDYKGINFVSRTQKNNGITAKVEAIKNLEPNPINTITVAVGGSVMESFLQKESYYTGYHVLVLKPKHELLDREMLYYCVCLRSNAFRYSYGRQANKTLRDIKIPSKDSIPQWVYKAQISDIQEKPLIDKAVKLNNCYWKYFNLKNLFNIIGSKSIIKADIQKYGQGEYPYVVTSSENNGVEDFYNYYTEEGNVLTIDSATVGSCFYQPLNFSASDHVEKLIPKFNMNKYIALFLTTLINLEKIRYGYGRKFAQIRIKKTAIKLPATPQGDPNWKFMEDYIKSLPYSSNL